MEQKSDAKFQSLFISEISVLMRTTATSKRIKGPQATSILHQVNTSADFIGRRITPTKRDFECVEMIVDYC